MDQPKGSRSELLKRPVFIPMRPKKDPREIKILDPACGSGHFLLYCFALLLVIYEEAYDDPDLGPDLQVDYPSKADLRKAIPGLILWYNLYGIDIDLRCTQIAALALWLRCQRAYQETGLKKERPPILKANVVCAEPMPGEEGLLHEFLKTLREDQLEPLIRQVMNVPKDQRVRATKGMVESLSDLVRTVWDKMRLAGEAGSLLKVEHELQDAIRQGQEQWEERLPLFRFTEYGLSEEPRERLVRFVPGDVEGERITFWDKAENLVRKALDEFVTFASNGGRFQRQLFVEDARQGLGFVDVCRRSYDIVLMNPPFGEPSKPSKEYVEEVYRRSKNDVYAAFVERGLGLLVEGGMLGAITSRTGFFLSSFQKWREELLLRESQPTVLADLGFGVLDAAKVETAAYCLTVRRHPGESVFIRLLQEIDNIEKLEKEILKIGQGTGSPITFLVNPTSFHRVPGSPFVYWVSEHVRSLFTELPQFQNDDRTLRQGLATSDDFRFVRAWWEVQPHRILGGDSHSLPDKFRRQTREGKSWAPIVKAGVNSPFYTDLAMVALWEEDGQEMKDYASSLYRQSSRTIKNVEWYFRPGITWPSRPWLRGYFSLVPPGALFTHTGMMLFLPETERIPACCLLNSNAYVGLLHLLMARGIGVEADQTLKYESGYLSAVPIPAMSHEVQAQLELIGTRCYDLLQSLGKANEISHSFVLPAALEHGVVSLGESKRLHEELARHIEFELADNLSTINSIAFHLYGISGSDRDALEQGLERVSPLGGGDGEDQNDDKQESSLNKPVTAELLSFAVGCAFGRWDLRLVGRSQEHDRLPTYLSPLPVSSPGMLQDETGLPASSSPSNYPISVDWEGILVDDPDHSDDIIRRVRDVLEVSWKNQADAIEKEACETLGVADLRDYFRRSGAGGFWDDHIKRYTKSRRKAPIYWLFQSSKKNFSLWVYYHRLDRDILFKALLNYVEPKIRKEEARLGELRSQKTTLDPAAKGGKKLDKDIDRQEAFLSELRDFEDKLRRAANHYLDPDLNDGVVLNIAPLWELVPWKEAKSYWDDLMDGKYEWSSIGKQLREKGLVK